MIRIFYKKNEEGFTLVEIMVSMTIFLTIMVLSSGSIYSVFAANQKSKNLRSVMDNLNLSLESMTRTIRFGKNYHCTASGNLSLPLDCGGAGSNSLTVLSSNGTQITFSLSSNRIIETIGGVNYFLTSSDATITNLTFRVYGSPAYNSGADLFQPQVIIVIKGNVGVKATNKSTFNLETTLSQKILDFP